MSYQVFSRAEGESPRRICVVSTIKEARAYCVPRNEKRRKDQRERHFFYEFAAVEWYREAFGETGAAAHKRRKWKY